MIALIIKDLKLSIKMNFFTIIYGLFVSCVGISLAQHLLADTMYILSIVIMVFIMTIYTNGFEDRYNTQIVLNSFPINRDNIVMGKYLTLMAYIIINCIVIFVFTNILKAAGFAQGNTVSILNLIIAGCICLVFYSVYYPFYFKLGEGIRTFNQVLWAMMFILPAAISKIGKKMESNGMLVEIYNKLSTLNLYSIALIVLILTLVMFYTSLQISKKLYRMREF
ncbi:MAG: ABC-2 transporter permease [Clostridia bacterium]|nr:ABC-2 transporter permease [Clostridia bacterium]